MKTFRLILAMVCALTGPVARAADDGDDARIAPFRQAAKAAPTEWPRLEKLLDACIAANQFGGKARLEKYLQQHGKDQFHSLLKPTSARIIELAGMAPTYETLRMPAQAVACYTQALAMCRKSPHAKEEANILADFARFHRLRGEYAEAGPLYESALAIREQVCGPNDPATASSLTDLGVFFINRGEYARAEPLLRRSLDIREKASPPDLRNTATTLDDLAALYISMGNGARAGPLFQRALEFREKASGPDDQSVACSLNNIAFLHAEQGDYAQAGPVYQRALAIDEKVYGINSAEAAAICGNLAGVYEKQGNHPKAQGLYERALAINVKALGPDHPSTALASSNLAEFYVALGDYAKAEPLLQQTLKEHEKVLGPNHPSTAKAYSNLANLYHNAGDLAKAEPLMQKALAIDLKALGPDHPDTATDLNNQAEFYSDIGDDAKALPLMQRALAIYEKAFGVDSPRNASMLDNLAVLEGRLYQGAPGFAKVEPLLRRALEINEKTLGSAHPETAMALDALALFYDDAGDPARAEPLLRRAVEIDGKASRTNPRDFVTHLNNLAENCRLRHGYAEAEAVLRRALEANEKATGDNLPMSTVILDNLAYVEIELGRTGEAADLATRSGKLKEARLGNVLSFTSEQQRLAFQRAADVFSLVATLGRADEAGLALLHNKGIVLDSLLEDRLAAEAARDEKQRGLIDGLRAAKGRFTRLLLTVPKDPSPEARKQWEADRDARAGEVERLEAALARQGTGLGRARQALGVTAAQVQGALAAGQALVEFVRYFHYLGQGKGEARYGAVVFGAAGELHWVCLGPADGIERNIALYAKSVRGQTDETTLREALRALHNQVWAPVENILPPNTGTVVLSPDAQLNAVSFATLLTPGNQFLIEKYSVRYVASGRDLLRAPDPAAAPSMAVFGDPDFGARTARPVPPDPVTGDTMLAARGASAQEFANVRLPPLPGTAQECRALETLAKASGTPSRLFLGADATQRHLREIRSPRILHLATHGFFLPKPADGARDAGPPGAAATDPARQLFLSNPMRRSGLALAGAQETFAGWARGAAPPGDDDGVITAEEVGGLKLEGTWLVVLSACDTGTGELEAGEGVLGLRRGFIQAGAQNLLMTLWPIRDEATVQLMLDFYERALREGNASRALSETQREWLVKLRGQQGLLDAVNLAGAFIINSQGRQ